MKWNKRIAIEYIQQMKSPIEEVAKQNGNGNQSSLIEKVRQAASRLKNVK